jgi:hypothetical protein
MGTSQQAYRISSNDVMGIIDFDPVIADLTPFIQAADMLITELCANANPPTGYSNDQLCIIETWLAAHFLAVRDPRYQSERMGNASASYQSMVGLNLGLTPYGQQAQFLDFKGGLAWIDKHISQGKRAVPSVTWVGSKAFNRWYGWPWRFLGIYNQD